MMRTSIFRCMSCLQGETIDIYSLDCFAGRAERVYPFYGRARDFFTYRLARVFDREDSSSESKLPNANSYARSFSAFGGVE